MKSSKSFKKRMDALKHDLPAAGGSKTTSGLGGAGTAPLKSASLKSGGSYKSRGKQGGKSRRKRPDYAIDESDKDGYIYWHENTRKTLGWVYLRFRPQRWYCLIVSNTPCKTNPSASILIAPRWLCCAVPLILVLTFRQVL